jgi:hypothetical protein
MQPKPDKCHGLQTEKKSAENAMRDDAYYFIFHSINSVPPRIMEMANYVVLYKTNDRDYIVQYKYPRLFQHFLDLQPMSSGSSRIIKIM